ncbi:MAG: sigma-70 family RNA polymerase sigma factor [Ruminococcaceae bacterium]|nr:sigma-70 family RNA polymerase sigma factor [Oscillospiraceae bacterium]
MITMMISAIENDFQREFITEIYKKYYSAMLKKAFSLLDNNEDAEELVQEVFADLIKRVDSVMAVERKKLPAYLFSAVKFSAYTRNKKQSRLNFSDFESEDIELVKDENSIPEEIYLKNEAVAELRAALEKIPEKYKNLLEFKYILGLSDSKIGERFGISESAVRSGLLRARRKAYSVMKEVE